MNAPTPPTPATSTTSTFDLDYFKDRHFGQYGGRYVPELLIPALDELETVYKQARESQDFLEALQDLYTNFAGRPTPLTYAKNLSQHLGGAQIYLKNEGCLHTGAHKLNNAMGQALLAKRMGKKKIIAETGAGQHGLATAAACARMGLECTVYMGAVDMKRQYSNVFSMQMMGAEVVAIHEGSQTLKDAVNATMKVWIERLADTHYIIGSALGPHPYPLMVRDFQTVIGRETRSALIERTGALPHTVLACTGGGSNALGIFHAFLGDPNVRLVAVEAGGRGNTPGDHAARMKDREVGIAQGYKSIFLQNEEGQIAETHSISAGLDYAGISPELAYLGECGRVHFDRASDEQCLEGYQLLARHEGILPALESAHAVAKIGEIARSLTPKDILVVHVSGRGDKDLFITAPALRAKDWETFLRSQLPSSPTAGSATS